jgi:RnfABCDGE-type electron transport complex B subunit
MTWLIVSLAAAVMLVLAIVMTWILGRAKRAWAVHEDPVVEKVQNALAGLDCGQCGHPTCNEYAHGIVEEGERIDRCLPGGPPTARAVAEILGIEAPEVGDHFAVVHCGADQTQRRGQVAYRGEPTCAGADVVGNVQSCVYGCLALGDCERSCPSDAIHVVDGLAVVDFHKCTACGNCVSACPRDIITIEHFPSEATVVVACCNRDPGKETRKVCPVGCIACGLCVKVCGELFEVRRNLSRLSYDEMDPDAHAAALVEASRRCPTGCLPYRGRGLPSESDGGEATTRERTQL